MVKDATKPSRGRRPREVADMTRASILSSAEQLFSKRGYYGVAVRDVAREAGVDSALVHYHFGSKDDLFSASLLSRAEGFMEERRTALDICLKESNNQPSIEAVIRAYTRPYLEHAATGDPGWRAWFRLLATASLSIDWAPSVWKDHFNPFVKEFIDALKLAAPEAPEGHYYWCYHFFSGALVMTFADTGRMDSLSDGQCKSDDLAAGYDLLVPFFSLAFGEILSGKSGPLLPIDPFRKLASEDQQNITSKPSKS